MNISVTVTGDKELMAKLDRLDLALHNWSKPLTTIGDDLIRYYRDTVFNSMGGVLGAPWAKLAPSTVAAKAKHYRQYSAVPLMATGQMRDSFRAEATKNALAITNEMPYFVYHQSSAPRTRLPRRQMMGINPDLKSLIQKIIKDYVVEQIERL